MTRDQRQHPRTNIKLPVKLTFEDGNSIKVETWDISDGGIGIYLPPGSNTVWRAGLKLKAQVQGLPIEGPVIPMSVVRITEQRIGLKMIET
jgi:c-di-GMP-binding flagellar brake protein YcgR